MKISDSIVRVTYLAIGTHNDQVIITISRMRSILTKSLNSVRVCS